MTINDHVTSFIALPVADFRAGQGVHAGNAWRIAVAYDAEIPWTSVFETFLAAPGAADVRALIVGNWGEAASGTDSTEVVGALVAARARLQKLEALFLGDIIVEEAEISWINQCDMSPIFAAYPSLLHFRVRGGNQLSFGSLKHAALRSLVVESGGLDASVVGSIVSADLPKLEQLELWLGDDGYGATWEMDDLLPLFAGSRFPALRTLALRNSCEADALARAVAVAPILERIEVLDLSLGTLGDEGAEALLASPAVKRLKKLDLHRHYLSDAMMTRLQALPAKVDVSDKQEPDRWDDDDHRYVAVSE
jgi:hypothetical protein